MALLPLVYPYWYNRHATKPQATSLARELQAGTDGVAAAGTKDLRLRALPRAGRRKHEQAKPLHGFGSAGVLEIVEDWRGNAYRAVYTVRFSEAVFVLHVFQKKATRGRETPKPDLDLIKDRLKAARDAAEGL